jgi:hypothetical protein
VAEVGLAPAGDLNAVRWIAIRHATNHIHILATLVRQDGRTAWTRQDYRQTHSACRRLERHFGLHQVATRTPTTVRPKPRELWEANREHRNEVPRDRLRREVRAVAATVDNEQGFFEQLRRAGLLLRVRTTNTNTVTGYAVALPDHRNAAGRAIWYGGTRLDRGLGLRKLRRRWHGGSAAPV